MRPNLDVHRHNDGSIDFDFYRRSASRRRRLVRRVVFKYYLTAIGQVGQASVSAIASLLSLLLSRCGDLRPILRASVTAAALLAAAAIQAVHERDLPVSR